LKALEAARSSASAVSHDRKESGIGDTNAFMAVVKESGLSTQTQPSETVSVIDCNMVLSSGVAMDGCSSSANLLVALSSDQLVATSQLLNSSLGQQKVRKVKLRKWKRQNINGYQLIMVIRIGC
jgi:hypothetical protein